MGDRYIPSRPRREERPRYAHDDDYDPYDRYDRSERFARPDRYDRYGGNERFRSPPPRSPPRHGRDDYGAQDAGYTFRGAAARTDDRAPPDHFSFRAPGGPRFPSPDRYAPPAPPRAPQRGGRRGDLSTRGDPRRGPHGQQNGRPRWRPPPPSERNILHETGRARTPEQLEGMNTVGQVRFNALASSSEESDDDQPTRPTSSSEEEGEIRRKRFKVDAARSELDVPKWSNPDPYSVLPPTETIGAPKKDIVAQIRKAKNQITPQDMSQAVAQNSDFISFTFDEDMNDDKASTGQNDAGDDHRSEMSSLRSVYMTSINPVNGAYVPNGDGVPTIHLKDPKRGEAKLPARQPPIDLSSDDEDVPAPPPTRTLRSRALSPIDLTGDDDAPPPPPTGFIMPTDEELMQQYIGQPKGKKRKHDEQSKGKGQITDAWAANWSIPTPWCTIDRSQTADVGLRLHEEITDFFDFVRPHQHEEAIRQDLIQRVQQAVRGMGSGSRNVDIKCFGSFAAGLYLPTADMDLVAVSQSFMSYGQRTFCQTGGKMHNLVRHLIRSGIAHADTATAVTRAKVPIVKFTDRHTGIKVDISFENDSGLAANQTFHSWKTQYPTMPVIVVLIKQLLAMRDLNEVFTGGLGGFSIICLVVSMLQLMPEDEYDNLNLDRSYGELLLKFLDLYGNQFNLRGTGIRMNPPGYYDKIRNPMAGQNANNLTIIDPNNPSNDISGGSREVHAVLEVFRKAHSQILQRMSKVQAGKAVNDSILGCVLGGNYTSFINQRNKLWQLYNGENLSPPPAYVGNSQPPPQKRGSKKPLDQDRPRKRLRSLGEYAPAPHGGPLESRVQGGPPVNKGYVDLFVRPHSRIQLAESLDEESDAKVSSITDIFSDSAAPQLSRRQRREQKTQADPGDLERARMLRIQHPQLASIIPQGLSKPAFKKFKSDHDLSERAP